MLYYVSKSKHDFFLLLIMKNSIEIIFKMDQNASSLTHTYFNLTMYSKVFCFASISTLSLKCFCFNYLNSLLDDFDDFRSTDQDFFSLIHKKIIGIFSVEIEMGISKNCNHILFWWNKISITSSLFIIGT